jgi:catechol 2,3-dioxygenase-like lactoylglutathione lyase family enzyme
MLSNKSIIAIVATMDADKAKLFYTEKLGLKIISEDNFAVAFDANGIMLRLTRVQKLEPAQYTALGWEVNDIHGTINELTQRGVKFEKYDFFKQDDSGVWTAPDRTQVAWFKDPDGNILSLTEFAR